MHLPRQSILCCVLSCLVIAGVDDSVQEAAAGESFEAGFASVDITPPIGWRRAGGYHEEVSTGVNDPLLAKAFVLSQDGVTVALVGNDLCSVPRDLTDAARRQAAEATGIPFANIVITATHTHGGPEYHGPLRDVLRERSMREHGGEDPREPVDYRAQLVDAWAAAIEQAYKARQPVSLSVVVPQQNDLAFNRRFLMKDGSTGWNPGRLNPDVFRPLGPTDPDLPFILARDLEGRPLGSLTVFAMHTAIFGGPEFGACYPGHLQQALREGLNAPQFISVFGEGCAGDINHIDVRRGAEPGVDYSQRTGQTIAHTIQKSLPLARPIAAGHLLMKSVTIESPVAPLSDDEYLVAQQLMNTLDRNEAPFLTLVDAWRKMFQHKFWEENGGKLPQEVQAIRLDQNTAIVMLPHEVFVELGMAIESASPFQTTIVISLANDVDFYIPVRRAFEEGHYEPTTCPLLPGCGERLVAAAVQLLQELRDAP